MKTFSLLLLALYLTLHCVVSVDAFSFTQLFRPHKKNLGQAYLDQVEDVANLFEDVINNCNSIENYKVQDSDSIRVHRKAVAYYTDELDMIAVYEKLDALEATYKAFLRQYDDFLNGPYNFVESEQGNLIASGADKLNNLSEEGKEIFEVLTARLKELKISFIAMESFTSQKKSEFRMQIHAFARDGGV